MRNLSIYDATLGWKGVPGGEAEFVTRNHRVWHAHNSHGFRDIAHDLLSDDKAAIVFFGDSLTWGYEVEFDDLFVNRLRARLPDYELLINRSALATRCGVTITKPSMDHSLYGNGCCGHGET